MACRLSNGRHPQPCNGFWVPIVELRHMALKQIPVFTKILSTLAKKNLIDVKLAYNLEA
jgi:hypothetical protein